MLHLLHHLGHFGRNGLHELLKIQVLHSLHHLPHLVLITLGHHWHVLHGRHLELGLLLRNSLSILHFHLLLHESSHLLLLNLNSIHDQKSSSFLIPNTLQNQLRQILTILILKLLSESIHVGVISQSKLLEQKLINNVRDQNGVLGAEDLFGDSFEKLGSLFGILDQKLFFGFDISSLVGHVQIDVPVEL